jgi:hypothetical protein
MTCDRPFIFALENYGQILFLGVVNNPSLQSGRKVCECFNVDFFQAMNLIYGYADIFFIPKTAGAHIPIVVELKWNKSPEGAIAQILEKKYHWRAKELCGAPVLLVGINYDKETKEHECVIQKFKG